MRIFVTGATGVIGRRVIPALIAKGHGVTGVARRPDSVAELQRQGAAAVNVDLFDARSVRDALEGHDTVLNLATHVPKTWRVFLPFAWKQNDRIRTQASANLVVGALSAGVERFVQESFAPVYPDSGDIWIDEGTPVEPARYNRSVEDAETSANRIAGSGRAGVILRFGLFYGENDPFTQMTLDTIRKGWSPFLGDPSAYLAMISHKDAASAVVAALELPTGVYNVVDDDAVQRGALVAELAQSMSARPPKSLPRWVVKVAGPVAKTMARSLRVSNRKLKTSSAWRPSFANTIEGWRSLL